MEEKREKYIQSLINEECNYVPICLTEKEIMRVYLAKISNQNQTGQSSAAISHQNTDTIPGVAK